MSTDNKMKFCPFCGSKIFPNAKFCVECGNKLSMLNIESSENTIPTNEKVIEIPANQPKIELKGNLNTIAEENNKEDKQEKTNEKMESTKEEHQNVKKSFSILNKKSKNKIKKEDNNFDLVRPNTTINPKQKLQHENNDKREYPKNMEEIDVTEFNNNGLPCPSCGNNMHLTQTSGFLSNITYHYCNNCSLKFRENRNFLILEEEPIFSRMNSKFHLKRYTYEEWKNILNGDSSPNFTKEFDKWKFDSPTSIKCPACNHDFVKYKGAGFGAKYFLICSGCSLTLEEHRNNLYSLHECIENYSPLWKYEKNQLSIEDMKRIIQTEDTEENRAFRELKVKEHELKVKQHQLKIKQQEDDLQLFANSLESGHPLLPVPSDSTIVLKKNEVPIYKLYNITLSEPRAIRTSKGGYYGTSYRITKGVTYHYGNTNSRSESHDEIKNIDQGELLITNQRVIFLGSNRTTNIDLRKIISISNDSNTIQIQRSNKQKPEYFSNINATESFQVEGRQYTVTIDGDIIKKMIIGLIK